MYQSLFRSPDDPWFREGVFNPDRLDYHVGDRFGFLKAHRRAARRASIKGPQGLKQIAPRLLSRIADARTLRAAWAHLEKHGGAAPGPNGHHYRDFEDHEVWNLLRALGEAIQAGAYRPGPDRQFRIPKSSGQGSRTLSLRNIEDRTVERAVVEIVQPLLDPLFDERSFGFRPGRDRRHALVLAESLTLGEHRPAWVLADLRDAFDNVPVKRVLDLVRRYLPADDLLGLIDRLLESPNRRGLRQGGPLSPLLLNLYLHHHLDRKWRDCFVEIPLIRVADDLLLLCRTEKEGQQAHFSLERLIGEARLSLKESTYPLTRLGGQKVVVWLGFAVWLGKKRLAVRLPESAWNRLDEHLALAHTQAHSPLRAIVIVESWLVQHAPAIPPRVFPSTYTRILRLAKGHGFDEIPSRAVLRTFWQRARADWLSLRRQERTRHGCSSEKPSSDSDVHSRLMRKKSTHP